MTRKELCAVVSLCWDVASHAPMEGVADGMFLGDTGDEKSGMATPRWQTYLALLNAAAPRSQVTVGGNMQMTEGHEPWQE